MGTVWVAVDVRGREPRVGRSPGIGDRAEIRFRATQYALDTLRRILLETAPAAFDGSRL